MRMRGWFLSAAFLCSGIAGAQSLDALGPDVRNLLRLTTSKVILEHVQIIDGTGAAPSADQNIHIEGGKITAISAGLDQSPIEGTTILDLRGRSVMPGIVGMHNHLYFMARPNLKPDGDHDGPTIRLQM